MKKFLINAGILLLCGMLFCGCSLLKGIKRSGGEAQNFDTVFEVSNGEAVTEYGAYPVPDGWYYDEELSGPYKQFYLYEDFEYDESGSNISVERGENKHSAAEHEKFRDAVVNQLLAQIADQKAELYGDGTYTDAGDILYVFTIVEEDGAVTIQYYIIGDHEYVLVHATDYGDGIPVAEASAEMASGFVWSEE